MNNDSTNTSDNSSATERDEHSLAAYVSDMLALERHIGNPLARQAQFEQPGSYANAMSLINRMKSVNDTHVASLERRLEELGGSAASPFKSAWASVLGAGASAIDSMRKTRVSKSLRDDYTALGLATAGYTMLNTAALALDDQATAALAKKHLSDYAPILMKVGLSLPEVVLQELQDVGVHVDPTVAGTAQMDAQEAWRNGSEHASTPSSAPDSLSPVS